MDNIVRIMSVSTKEVLEFEKEKDGRYGLKDYPKAKGKKFSEDYLKVLLSGRSYVEIEADEVVEQDPKPIEAKAVEEIPEPIEDEKEMVVEAKEVVEEVVVPEEVVEEAPKPKRRGRPRKGKA